MHIDFPLDAEHLHGCCMYISSCSIHPSELQLSSVPLGLCRMGDTRYMTGFPGVLLANSAEGSNLDWTSGAVADT